MEDESVRGFGVSEELELLLLEVGIVWMSGRVVAVCLSDFVDD